MTSHRHDLIVYRVDTAPLYIEDSCNPAAHLECICIVCSSLNTMSSGENEGRSYEMDDVVASQPGEVAWQPGEVEPMSFKNMFKTILKAYDDERKWWVAVENFLKNENGDFATEVRAKTHTGGRESRHQAIVEVMVDLLLNMEEITVHQGLSYVLDELKSYPLKFLAIELLKRGANLEAKDADIENENSVKRSLEDLMSSGRNISDDVVREKIWELSPSSVLKMFRPECCGGEGKFNFLEQFVQNPMLKKSTMAILDQFVVDNGQDKMVLCEVIDADTDGIPPDDDSFNCDSPCLLDVIVKSDNKELAQHPAIRAILDYKWTSYAKRVFITYLMLYAAQMLFFGPALLIAARPGLDNPGCYRDGWDFFRGFCEGMAFIIFLVELFLLIFGLCSVPKSYLKDKCVDGFLRFLRIILPFLIIPFRAATTWCASTGDGYCVDPTLLHNTSNATSSILNINQSCITASSVQWIVASLAYMVNAIWVLKYLRPFRSVSIYVRALHGIIVQDLCTFSAIFLVVLHIFIGSFYLALRAGVYVDVSTGAITSDVEQFSLQTLYPWHVMFTGLRSLVEAGGILDGNYFANDNNGQYIGYQWFSVVMYMAFLFTVIVVLLNVLIAQMSHTYRKLQESIDGTFNIIRATGISEVQKLAPIPFRWTTSWQHHYKRAIPTEYTDEEQKQYLIRKTERARFVEMKQNNLTKMRDDLARQQQERLMEEKVDQLTEMTAELTRRLQVWEKRWPFEMGAQ